MGRHTVEVAPDAMEALVSCDRPGNVRELADAVEGALISANGSALSANDLPWKVTSDATSLKAAALEVPCAEARRRLIQTFNRGFAVRLLGRHAGNVAHAAREAGMERADPQRVMRKARVEPGDC